MNIKRYITATSALFLFIIISGRILHGYGLDDLYNSTASLWRSEAALEQNMYYFWISRLILSALITYFFATVYSHGGWKSGMRFGLFFGLISAIFSGTWYFWLPVPAYLGWSWFFISFVETFLGCSLVGIIYRK